MKNFTALCALMVGIGFASGQPVVILHHPGVVAFQNTETANAPGVPSHLVTNIDGTLLIGTQYKAELYYLDTITSILTPIAESLSSFRPLGTSVPGAWVGPATPISLPLGYGGVDFTSDGMEAGDGTGTGPGYYPVTLAVRVWDSTTGGSYETATITGSSANFTYIERYSTPPAVTDTMMLAQRAFQLVPEPSRIALSAAGGALLLLLRRRNRDQS